MSSQGQENLSSNWQKKETLNLPVPYSYSWDGNRYIFKTEHGFTYSVYFFTETQSLYEEYPWHKNIYEMSFDCEGWDINTALPDKSVSLTIMEILEKFFLNEESILTYSCETLDSLEHLRYRLFNQWFYKFGANKYFEKASFITPYYERTLYVSMIFNKSHPFNTELTEAFYKVCNEVYSL